jgi:hypothetical protein
MTDQSSLFKIDLSTFFGFYCPTTEMGEKPSPSVEEFTSAVATAARIQAKARMVFSLESAYPWSLGPQAFGFSRGELTF